MKTKRSELRPIKLPPIPKTKKSTLSTIIYIVGAVVGAIAIVLSIFLYRKSRHKS